MSDYTKGQIRPVLFGDICDEDAKGLRELAEWFDLRGKPLQAAFLRDVATRHEVLAGAYSTATVRAGADCFD